MIKASLDLSILKKLFLLPRQRALYSMQKKQAFKVDSDSEDDDGAGEAQLDQHGRNIVFYERNPESLLNLDFKNQTDRRLLLGLMFRDNDLNTSHAATQEQPKMP